MPGLRINPQVVATPAISLAVSGALAETIPRAVATWANQNAALVSGTLRLQAIELRAGMTVTNVGFVAGTTAAVAPTNWWFGLFDSARAILKLTADQTSTAWAANEAKVVALSSAHQIPATGLYYLGIMVAAGTVPSLCVSASGITSATGLAPILTGNTTNTGLTTPASLGAGPAGAITVAGGYPYAWVT